MGLLHQLYGSAFAFRDDVLGFYRECERTAGVVRTHVWRAPIYVVTDPFVIEEILVRHHRSFAKSAALRFTERAFGRGLLTSDGALWRQQRNIIQPAFHARRLDHYRPHMRAAMSTLLASWGEGGIRDVHQDMTDFCFEVLALALFGEDMARGRPYVVEAAEALHAFHHLFSVRWIVWSGGLILAGLRAALTAIGRPDFTFDVSIIPTAYARRFREAVAALDSFAAGLIERRRREGANRDDLLSMLLNAKDAAGQPLSDKQIRDEVVTMFFAGHETGAGALSWAFYLLARHPEIASALVNETSSDEGSLTDRVIRESLRLYPPAHRISRTVVKTCEAGGHMFKAGAEVLIPQWAVHRSPRWYSQPDEFQPDRWTPELIERLPRFAYFPFGGGSRTCIGNTFALQESAFVLRSVLGAYELSVSGDAAVEPQMGVTLLPKGGSLRLKVRRRTTGPAVSVAPPAPAGGRGRCPVHRLESQP